MTLAKGAHGQAAVLPAFEELSPVLLLARITGFALWHEQNLQDRVKEVQVPKLTTQTRTGPTGRLPPFRGGGGGGVFVTRPHSFKGFPMGWPPCANASVVLMPLSSPGGSIAAV